MITIGLLMIITFTLAGTAIMCAVLGILIIQFGKCNTYDRMGGKILKEQTGGGKSSSKKKKKAK